MAEKGEIIYDYSNNEKAKKRNKLIVIVIILLLIIGFGLFFSYLYNIFKEDYCTYPGNGHIIIDSNDDIHVFWEEGVLEGKLFYQKEDYNGNILIKKKNIFIEEKNSIRINNLFIDSFDNIHLLYYFYKWVLDTETKICYVYHLKIDTNGNILEKSFVFDTSLEEKLDLDYFMIASFMDKNDNIHIIWYIDNLKVHYHKINNLGEEIITNRVIKGFFEDVNWAQNRFPEIYFSFVVDSDDVIHGLSYEGYSYDVKPNITGYHKYYSNNNTIIPVNKSISGTVIDIDPNDYIYIISKVNLIKMNNNGIIVNKTKLSNISVIPGYPVVKDDNGTYLYIGKEGFIDSKKNIHLIKSIYEDRYTSGYYNYIQTFSVKYYLIDLDGNIIKEKTLAVSEAKYHER